jgi:hypothetical protein
MRMWNPVTFELEVANFGTFPQDETNFYKKVASPPDAVKREPPPAVRGRGSGLGF